MTLRARTATAVAALPLALCLGLLPATTTGSGAHTPERAEGPDAGPATSVLVVSVDGLNPAAVRVLGPSRAPTFHLLGEEGASTTNARSSYESTSTLPNHTGMVTGRRVRASDGGHGVVWNDQRKKPRTVHVAAGEPVSSIFTVAAESGGRPAVFASKPKFSLFARTWGSSVHRSVIVQDNDALVRRLVRDLRTRERSLRLLHLSWPDGAGHQHGYMSKKYLQAVAKVDAALGRVLTAVEQEARLDEGLVVLVTSDHGGGGRAKTHDTARRQVNYRVPFYAYGPGVPAGADLYDLNPAYVDPRRGRPRYNSPEQPIRNIAVGNVALDLLGLPAIPGSTINATQDLEVRR